MHELPQRDIIQLETHTPDPVDQFKKQVEKGSFEKDENEMAESDDDDDISGIPASETNNSNLQAERSELKDWTDANKIKNEQDFLSHSKDDFEKR